MSRQRGAHGGPRVHGQADPGDGVGTAGCRLRAAGD
jgi:hypothetical protein